MLPTRQIDDRVFTNLMVNYLAHFWEGMVQEGVEEVVTLVMKNMVCLYQNIYAINASQRIFQKIKAFIGMSKATKARLK